jgi:peptide/nickel transport system permease protein
MAFPLLLFLLYANRYLIGDIRSVGWSWVIPDGAIGEMVLIGIFTAFYPIRLIRAQLFTLRHAEFVDAAHMVGASSWRILRRHLFPHVAPILLVWGALAIGTNMLAEVGLSFLGVGVQGSTPTLGSLLSSVWGTIYAPHTYDSRAYTPWQTIFPMATIVLTVVCLNRLSEGLRRASEPRGAG